MLNVESCIPSLRSCSWTARGCERQHWFASPRGAATTWWLVQEGTPPRLRPKEARVGSSAVAENGWTDYREKKTGPPEAGWQMWDAKDLETERAEAASTLPWLFFTSLRSANLRGVHHMRPVPLRQPICHRVGTLLSALPCVFPSFPLNNRSEGSACISSEPLRH